MSLEHVLFKGTSDLTLVTKGSIETEVGDVSLLSISFQRAGYIFVIDDSYTTDPKGYLYTRKICVKKGENVVFKGEISPIYQESCILKDELNSSSEVYTFTHGLLTPLLSFQKLGEKQQQEKRDVNLSHLQTIQGDSSYERCLARMGNDLIEVYVRENIIAVSFPRESPPKRWNHNGVEPIPLHVLREKK